MIAVELKEATDVAEARRRALAAASAAGFDELGTGRIAIAATELSTNAIRHGGGGEMLVACTESGVDLIALDRGPGMTNIAACLSDGYSTGGTRGEGLGAVQRQAAIFDIYSAPGKGSAVLAGFTLPDQPRQAWAGLNVPYPGEEVSGDAWAVRRDKDGLVLIVADGLGHGLMAAEAAGTAIRAFEERAELEPVQYLEYAQGVLRPTRGAAVAIARLHSAGVRFAGVGNISGALVSRTSVKKMISHNGTLGHVARRFQAFDYAAEPPWLVVMHSDGLATSWNIEDYPGLASADPALIAAVLYRDFSRRRDDASILVARGPA